MPRQERTKSGTGIYHVMLRGINKQDMFEDDEDYLQMTACLQGLTERYDENGVVHSQVNERLWCGNTPALSIDRCLLWSYTEVMKKEKMITESLGHFRRDIHKQIERDHRKKPMYATISRPFS